MQTPTPRPLAGPLRSRINQLAHLSAIEHEGRIRAALLEQFTKARDEGATYEQLCAMAEAAECATPVPRSDLYSFSEQKTNLCPTQRKNSFFEINQIISKWKRCDKRRKQREKDLSESPEIRKKVVHLLAFVEHCGDSSFFAALAYERRNMI
ncbi:MAG: hypothetical protein V4731_15445 [Pseudomonadota bacterium]